MANVLNLNEQAQNILAVLVSKLPTAVPDDPRTFIGYKEMHDELGLELVADTYGDSLKSQGLLVLADWTATTSKPGISGLIIDRETLMPGEGYFKVFGRRNDDFIWWVGQVERSKSFDWSPYIPIAPAPATPTAIDMDAPSGRHELTTYRILRDGALARRVKLLHNYQCQICGHSILLLGGERYAEAHHIRPLGEPHNGPDRIENIICLCPNHHAELDFGARAVNLNDLKHNRLHVIDEKYIQYHNEHVCKII